MQQS
jgi:hypothetical protein